MSTSNDNNDHQNGGGEETSNKEECTSCEQNNVDNITEDLNSVSLDDMSACANCGKEGNSDNMNTCNKCKEVKYCNAVCKKKHRSKHKKACEKRVAELHEEKLFKEIEPEECPICMVPLQIDPGQTAFHPCCGKLICSGCVYSMKTSKGGIDLCAFCRTPLAESDEDSNKRVKKLMDSDNAYSFYMLARCYAIGKMGMPQDFQKANELYLRAGELGCPVAYYNLGQSYRDGSGGLEVDEKKATYYYELAAMGGSAQARNNLGCLEEDGGNYDRAFKHWKIAARAGHENSLDAVKQGFKLGLVTKDEYASTLRAYHERQKETKSEERDEAAKVLASMRRRGFRS